MTTTCIHNNNKATTSATPTSKRRSFSLKPLQSPEHRASLEGLRTSSLKCSPEQQELLLDLIDDADFLGRDMERCSSFMKPAAQQCLAKFHPDEVVVGELLARGGYNYIFELKSIVLRHNQNSSETEEDGSTSATSPNKGHDDHQHDDESSKQRLDLAYKVNSEQNRYVVKFLASDLKLKRMERGALDLVREAKMLANLHHPNIIALRGLAQQSTAGFAQGTTGFFLIMDRLEETLVQRIQRYKKQEAQHGRVVVAPLRLVLLLHKMLCFRNRVKDATTEASAITTVGKNDNNTVKETTTRQSSFPERFDIIVQLAAPLVYLHSKNVVLRDVKPENIGFTGKTSRSTLQIFDLGLAKELPLYNKVSPTSSLYNVGSFGGTHPYVAPEIALGQPYGLSADTYSFAIVCYQVLTMRDPFGNYMEHDYVDKIIHRGQRPKLPSTTKSSGWTDELKELLSQCWNADPEARPSMEDVYTRLQAMAQGVDKDALKFL